MKEHRFSRSELIIGKDNLNKLSNATVCVLGIGGVGGNATEALARAGVGNIIIVDNDTVALTNINRQIVATTSTIGKYKVDIMKKRIEDINPDCNVIAHKTFISKENVAEIVGNVDFVIDAIDTVTSKLDVIEYCKNNDIQIVVSLGTGNKFDPTRFQITDISKTKICPLAKVMRHELKNRRIKKVNVLYSDELPVKPVMIEDYDEKSSKRQIPGSMSYVPPVAGLILTSHVVNNIIGK